MQSLNKIFLMGRLGHEPELQVSKAGKPYCRLRMATHESWMNKDEEREERTEWHSVFTWGPTAERCAHQLQKGSLVFVEGSLTHWQDAQNKDHKTAIHANVVKFLVPSQRGLMGKSAENLDNPDRARNHNAVAHLTSE